MVGEEFESEKYRNDIPFTSECYAIARDSIVKFMKSINSISNNNYRFKFNKATLFSWFVLIKSKPEISVDCLGEIIFKFEAVRDYLKGK